MKKIMILYIVLMTILSITTICHADPNKKAIKQALKDNRKFSCRKIGIQKVKTFRFRYIKHKVKPIPVKHYPKFRS